MESNKKKGDAGEKIALYYLKNHGYRILETNFRTRAGEIDIIAQKEKIIAFVEVKYRAGNSFGLPREAVDARKRRKIINAALIYSQRIEDGEICFRFDVIELLGSNLIELNHIEDAFLIE